MYQGHLQSFGINTGAGPEPTQEQQDDSEPDSWSKSKHGTPEPWNGPPPQTDIEFRIAELHNRRFLLLKMQRFRKRTEDNGVGTTEESESMNLSTQIST
ncbi:hypothetical protein VZT92_012151 [Zoarces viviparus]|uniref:Uncharacterized protein n=1 Tax=Zoarces viviparus TaxID=48416 RepID=A0AAW1F7T9_ZOAVI